MGAMYPGVLDDSVSHDESQESSDVNKSTMDPIQYFTQQDLSGLKHHTHFSNDIRFSIARHIIATSGAIHIM